MDTRTVTNADLSKEEKIRQRLYVESKQDGGNPSEFLEMLSYVTENRIWEPLGISFRQLIEAPFPTGIGSSKEEIETIRLLHHRHEDGSSEVRARMKEMRTQVWNELNPALAVPTVGDGTPGPGRGNKTVDIINRLQGGTSETYTISRLKRDRPDLAERVLDEDDPLSANAAAIEAGFREKTITVRLEPQAIARTLIRRLSKDQMNDLIVELTGSLR